MNKLVLLLIFVGIMVNPATSQFNNPQEDWNCYTENAETSPSTCTSNPEEIDLDQAKVKVQNNIGLCGYGGIARTYENADQTISLNVGAKFSHEATNYGQAGVYVERDGEIYTIKEWKGGGTESNKTVGWTTVEFNPSNYGDGFLGLSGLLGEKPKVIIGNDDAGDYCRVGDHRFTIWATDEEIQNGRSIDIEQSSENSNDQEPATDETDESEETSEDGGANIEITEVLNEDFPSTEFESIRDFNFELLVQARVDSPDSYRWWSTIKISRNEVVKGAFLGDDRIIKTYRGVNNLPKTSFQNPQLNLDYGGETQLIDDYYRDDVLTDLQPGKTYDLELEVVIKPVGGEKVSAEHSLDTELTYVGPNYEEESSGSSDNEEEESGTDDSNQEGQNNEDETTEGNQNENSQTETIETDITWINYCQDRVSGSLTNSDNIVECISKCYGEDKDTDAEGSDLSCGEVVSSYCGSIEPEYNQDTEEASCGE